MPDPSSSSSPPNEPRSSFRQTLDYITDAEKRWWHHAFSRENILDALKTFAWVGPLTILIWVYAEREQIPNDPSPVPFAIEVKSNDPNRVVILRKPAEKLIMAELNGPRAKVDQVRDVLSGGMVPRSVPIDIDASLSPGRHEIRTIEAIKDNPIFRDNGISVNNCQPPMLQIEVDQIIERDIDVQLPPGIDNLSGVPLIEPRKVHVRGPQSLLDGAAAQGQFAVYADVAGLDVLRIPGHHELPAVPVIGSVREDHITITPSTVKVSFDVKQSNIEYPINSMAIFTIAPPGLLDRYKVVIANNNPFLTNVTVIGPQEKIELIQKDSIVPKPRATLEVTREDLPAGESRLRRLRYELPEGVTVSPDDAKREVEFKLIDRNATEP